MHETKKSKLKKHATALAVASFLSVLPVTSQAAGLGKLTVLSGLGQPLRAEMDIAASNEELAGMSARLAPPDSFRQAGIDYASVLLDLRFAIEKRPNGQSVVKVSSSKPVNEPFMDFLVELNWPAGRLVREYTFLLDPPEIAARQSSASVAEARVVETVRGGAGLAADRPQRARPAPRQTAAPAPRVSDEPKKAAPAPGDRVVQTGETLRKIAVENKYDGVSLEQMLVGYLQKNPDAFVGGNVNRMKAGAILAMPEKSAVEAVSPEEAKKVYVTRSGDWNAYRQKLASSVARSAGKPDTAAQTSTGKITAKVEEKTSPADQAKDQVKVSKTEMASKAAPAGASAKPGGAAEADAIAREKALKEAQERLATLEKNVGELQKLVEMKNQKLAELQQQAAKPELPKPVESAKAIEPVKPLEAPKPVDPPKAVEPQKVPLPEPAKAEEAPKPVEVAKTVEQPKPVEPPKPVDQPKPTVAKAPVVQPEPEPGFIDSLLSDPLPLAGAGGLLALLASYFVVKRRRSENAAVETTAAPGPSSLGPNSVFRMTGGQSVDTGNTPPQTGEFSQTGPGTIDTDEVDPVAEADVYMAYGRDTQAEEILLEALQKDPQRTAIHAKLLEIYANRRSLKQFETLASELYAQTGGVGPEWDKVAVLGAGLDPNNPLYSGVAASTSANKGFDADATMIVSPMAMAKATQVVQSNIAESAAESTAIMSSPTPAKEFENDTLVITPEPAPAISQPEPSASDSDVLSLDFDLDSGADLTATKPMPEPASIVSEPDPVLTSDALDFDLGVDSPIAAPAEVVGELQIAEDDSAIQEIDFNLDGVPAATVGAEEPSAGTFSPAGTLVMPHEMEHAEAPLANLTSAPALPDLPVEEDDSSIVDFDLDTPAVRTSVNPVLEDPSTATMVTSLTQSLSLDESDENLVRTVVNPESQEADSLDFDVKLTDSVFLGQPMSPPEFDIGSINLDLSAEAPAAQTLEQPSTDLPSMEPPVEFDEAVTQFKPEATARLQADLPDHFESEATLVMSAESLQADMATPAGDVPMSEEESANWEEVNTKLDLAKAYEEMGDLEGARELLQEVVGEGPVDLVEQARTILARIGE